MVGAPWNPTVTDYPALDGVDLTDAVVTARSDSGDALYFTSTDGLGDGTTGVDTLYRLDLEDTSVSTVFETGDLHLGLNDGAGTCEMALQAITPDVDADTDNDGDTDDDADVAAVLEIGFVPDDSGGVCGPHSATADALIRVALDVDAPDDPDPDAIDADAEGNQSLIAIDATDSLADVAISEDATRIAFATDAPLASGDTDAARDIYATGSPIVAAGSAQQGDSPNPEHNLVQTLLREATGTHRHVAVAMHEGDFTVIDGDDDYHQLGPPAYIAQIDWTIDAGDLVTAGEHVQVGVYDGAHQQPLRRLTYYLPPECYICT